MNLLDDLEVAGELPIGDGLAGLTLLPFARGRIMLDEGVAEEFTRSLGALQTLGGLAEGARQGPLLGMLDRIGIAFDGLTRIDPVLDAPEAGADRGGQRDIRVDVGGSDPVLHALRLFGTGNDAQ